MKLDQLRKIIREEVRSAVKEELQDMLNEAVEFASKPEKNVNLYKADKTGGFTAVKQKDLKRSWSTGKMNTGTVPLEEMINQTAQSMTSAEFKNITGATPPSAPNLASSMASNMGMTQGAPGLDISKLDFVSKAKSVLDASYAKDKARLG